MNFRGDIVKNGDLANTAGVTIAFRCEDFLIEYKDTSFTDKVLNKIWGKTKRAEVNQTVRAIMEHFYRNTEYNVDLIVESSNYDTELKVLLDELPFNRVISIDKLSQISSRLLTGDISYYIDNDAERRSLVNSKYAIPLSDLTKYIKGRR